MKNPQDPSSPSLRGYSSYETPLHGKTKQSPRRSDQFSPRNEHEHERFNSNSPSMEASSISSNRRPPPSSSSPSPSALAQGRQVAARDSVPVYRSPYGSSESLSDLHHAESDESEHGRSTTAIKNPDIASKDITSPIISVNGREQGTDEGPRSRILKVRVKELLNYLKILII
ncbi:unnamed protein product [[Candida] boidinii]|nr:unnamed protein product [[Candida] boidinii]